METRLEKTTPTIRKATLNDIPALANLHSESFGASTWNSTQITNSLTLETTLALMACLGREAKGFIFCQIVRDEAEILTLCVTPSARCEGVGTLLLKSAMEASRQRKVKRLFLEVRADNKAALALYDKAGFKTTGRRSGYYKQGGKNTDAVTLALDL